MISLIIPPRDQVSRVNKMLGDELGTATNIKSRVNRLSVLSAITSTQQRLKLYNKIPPNGLVLYCGTILTDDNKEKKLNIDFEPFKPINTSLYLCDNKFHTEALQELLQDDERFGFIVMDGNGCLVSSVMGRLYVHSSHDYCDPSYSTEPCAGIHGTCCISSRLICRRSTDVEDSPRCVLHGCVWRSVTITCGSVLK